MSEMSPNREPRQVDAQWAQTLLLRQLPELDISRDERAPEHKLEEWMAKARVPLQMSGLPENQWVALV